MLTLVELICLLLLVKMLDFRLVSWFRSGLGLGSAGKFALTSSAKGLSLEETTLLLLSTSKHLLRFPDFLEYSTLAKRPYNKMKLRPQSQPCLPTKGDNEGIFTP